MSITEVASRAGVSPGTVSRVINNRPGISPATVKKVRDTIEQVGYVPRTPQHRPGPRLKQSNGVRTATIAMLTMAEYKSQLESPVYANVIHGAEAELADNEMSMLLHRFDPNRIPAFIQNRQVDGILLFSGTDKLPPATRKILQQFPAVSILGETRPWCDHVTYDNSTVGVLAAKYLIEKGHQNLAFIGADMGGNGVISRIAPFRDTAEKAGKNVSIITGEGFGLINESVNTICHDRLKQAVEEFIKLNPRPTGIMVPADMYAAPLYSILIEHGIVPGKDVEVVSVNNESPLLAGLRPQPATVDIRSYTIGQMAAKRLMRRLENTDDERMTIMLDPVLVPAI